MTNLSLNRVEIIGFLGGDPEYKSTNSGARYMTMNVATAIRWRNQATGEWREKTEWHRVTVWLTYLISAFEKKHVRKGYFVRVVGRLETRDWTDAKGAERSSINIVVSSKDAALSVIRTKNSNSHRDPETGDATVHDIHRIGDAA